MAIGVINPPLLSFQQANPFLSGISSAQDIVRQALANQQAQVQNQYLSPMLAAQLQQTQMQNQLTGAQIPYASQMALAKLQESQAMPGYYGAETQGALARAMYDKAQASALTEKTPYEIQKMADEAGKSAEQVNMMKWALGMPDQMPTLPQTPNQQNKLQQIFGGTQQTIAPSQYPVVAQGVNAINAGLTAPATLSQTPLQQAPAPQAQQQPLSDQERQQRLLRLADVNAALGGKSLPSMAITKPQMAIYDRAQKDAYQTADDATQMSNLVDQFRDSYDKSKYKGTALGNTPSTGLGAIPLALAGQDLSNEQSADNAAQNMQAMLLKLMKTNRLTNYELKFVGNLKLSRRLDPTTVNMLGDFYAAKADRAKEYQDFLNSSRDQGIDLNMANSLWERYNNEKPVYDFKNKSINKDNKNQWAQYISPDEINRVKSGAPMRVARETKSEMASGLNDKMIQQYMQKYPGRTRDEIIRAYSRMGG